MASVFPYTGPISAQGRPERDAIKQAFEEENNTIAGRKIELLYEDGAGRPDTGLTKIKALVERDKVHLLLSNWWGCHRRRRGTVRQRTEDTVDQHRRTRQPHSRSEEPYLPLTCRRLINTP